MPQYTGQGSMGPEYPRRSSNDNDNDEEKVRGKKRKRGDESRENDKDGPDQLTKFLRTPLKDITKNISNEQPLDTVPLESEDKYVRGMKDAFAMRGMPLDHQLDRDGSDDSNRRRLSDKEREDAGKIMHEAMKLFESRKGESGKIDPEKLPGPVKDFLPYLQADVNGKPVSIKGYNEAYGRLDDFLNKDSKALKYELAKTVEGLGEGLKSPHAEVSEPARRDLDRLREKLEKELKEMKKTSKGSEEQQKKIGMFNEFLDKIMNMFLGVPDKEDENSNSGKNDSEEPLQRMFNNAAGLSTDTSDVQQDVPPAQSSGPGSMLKDLRLADRQPDSKRRKL